MTELEINKQIAEFMGVDVSDFTSFPEEGRKAYRVEDLQYNTSWDWLMPVVKEVERIGSFDSFPMGIRMTSRPTIVISMRDVELYFYPRKGSGIHIVANLTGKGYSHPMCKTNIFIQFNFDKEELIKAVWLVLAKFIELFNTQLKS